MGPRMPIVEMRRGHWLFLGGVGLLVLAMLIAAALAAPLLSPIVQASPVSIALFGLIVAAWVLVFVGIHVFMRAGVVSESREEIPVPGEVGGGFVCSDCGRDIGVDAERCPHCGAQIEGNG